MAQTAGEMMIYPPVTATYRGERVRLLRMSGLMNKYFEVLAKDGSSIPGVAGISLKEVQIHSSIVDVPEYLTDIERKVFNTSCLNCGVRIFPPRTKYCSTKCKYTLRQKLNPRKVRVKKEEPPKRECPNCHKSLQGKPLVRVYCSTSCGKRYRNKKLREQLFPGITESVPCAICGAAVILRDRRQKYCSDPCRDEGNRRLGLSRDKLRRIRYKKAKLKVRIPCGHCRLTFVPAVTKRLKYCSEACHYQGQLRNNRVFRAKNPRKPKPAVQLSSS